MREGVDRWRDTGEKTSVFAFDTSWSGSKEDINVPIHYI